MAKKQSPFFVKQGEQYQGLRDHIGSLLDKWIPVLGLDAWSIDFEYQSSYAEDKDVLARAWGDWRYKFGGVSFYLPPLSDQSAEEIENTVIHELLHIVVEEMHPANFKPKRDLPHEERVVTELAAAFMRAAKLKVRTKR